MRPRTFVYIDGFNFYYGSIRRTPYRWLDLFQFSKCILPKNEIVKVKYFTAIVQPTPGDNLKSVRQKTYLRALATIPQIEVFLGSFQAHAVRRPLADGSGSAEVIDMKEKGSDVNLATELLVDAYTNAFDVAVLVTNDSDLAAPVSAVCRLGKPVGILNPHKRPSFHLRECASFIKPVRPWALQQSLLPATLRDSTGEIHKPAGW
jgi:uncharacterized LabA/DUF88 family protein